MFTEKELLLISDLCMELYRDWDASDKDKVLSIKIMDKINKNLEFRNRLRSIFGPLVEKPESLN